MSAFRPSFWRAGLCTALLGAALTAPVAAIAQALSPAQKAEVETTIREYLLKNPEVLRDALVELENRQRLAEKKQQADALQSQKAALYDDPAAIIVGNPKGDVTLVEFFDYNCGYCKRAVADLQTLVKTDPKLRVVLKDFPILGPESVEASRIAVAVKKALPAEKALDYHVRLMESKGRIGKDRALEVAKEMGLDPARIQKESEGAAVQERLQKTMQI
ncbi:MAG: DsbA family protein, partial [Beijerinckiaceae bacterium]